MFEKKKSSQTLVVQKVKQPAPDGRHLEILKSWDDKEDPMTCREVY